MLAIRPATVQQAQDAAEARRAVVADADSTNVATARHTVVMTADGAVAAAARFGAGAGAQAALTGAVTVEVGQRRHAEQMGDEGLHQAVDVGHSRHHDKVGVTSEMTTATMAAGHHYDGDRRQNGARLVAVGVRSLCSRKVMVTRQTRLRHRTMDTLRSLWWKLSSAVKRL